mgnify:CR=1 FL=1
MVRISVVMATYNGERYLQQQVDSILQCLEPIDQLIVSDDGSRDGTRRQLGEYENITENVEVIDGPRQGIIANFENGLKRADGDIIFLADQDDVWFPNKVEVIKRIFQNDERITCVLHDVEVVDEDLNILDKSFFEIRGSKLGFVNNLIKNSFMGSAMAFKASLLPAILPIPRNVPMHDQWIGLINELYGKTAIYRKPLGLYRRHGGNASTLDHGSLRSMLINRLVIADNLVQRARKVSSK